MRDSKIPMLKGVCVIPNTPDEIISVIADFDDRKKYDDLFDKGKKIETIDLNTKVVWNSAIKPWALKKPRDFCLVSCKAKVGDAYVVAAKSTQHPGRPATNSHVRANVLLGGWYLEPVSDGTKCSFLSWVDLKLTGMFLNKKKKGAREKILALPGKIRDYMRGKKFAAGAEKIAQELATTSAPAPPGGPA